MHQALCWVKVLSTGYEVLYDISWQDAMKDLCGGRLEIVEEHPHKTIGLVFGKIPMPTVVKFKKGVFLSAIKAPRKTRKPNRKNIFIRDKGKCQYCDEKLSYSLSTIDHIIPRSKGGKNTWNNLVLCCGPCNIKKGNRSPSEVGLSLRAPPRNPSTQKDIYKYGGSPYESKFRCFQKSSDIWTESFWNKNQI
jgi:5-methylcytosine-specific restriction endonuclease McrA